MIKMYLTETKIVLITIIINNVTNYFDADYQLVKCFKSLFYRVYRNIRNMLVLPIMFSLKTLFLLHLQHIKFE